MPSEDVNYVQRVDRMLNRWAGVKSSAQPKDRTRVEIGKASQNGDSGSFEVSKNATVVMGEIFSFVASDSTRAWSIPAALTNVPKNEGIVSDNMTLLGIGNSVQLICTHYT